MFLRNQFKGVGMFHLPLVKKQPIQLDSVALIGYDKLSEGETEKIVHFFLDDNKFGSIYSQTEEKVETLKRFKAVLTPDFSMYTEMPTALQLYNCFRNRWVGAFLQSKGVTVFPLFAGVIWRASTTASTGSKRAVSSPYQRLG